MKTYNLLMVRSIICAIILFLLGCSKSEKSINQPAPADIDSIFILQNPDHRLHLLVDLLKADTNTIQQLGQILETYGTPLWAEAIIDNDSNTTLALVPLYKSKNSISGIWVLEQRDNFRWRIIDTDNPGKYGYNNKDRNIDARTIYILKQAFNKELFNARFEPMPDPCLMSARESALLANSRKAAPELNAQLNFKIVVVEKCYSWTVCMKDSNGECVIPPVLHTECIIETIWFPDGWVGGAIPGGGDGMGGGGGGASGGSNGGGGGGGGGAGQGCNTNQENGTEVFQILPPERPIDDILKYLECFVSSMGASITFFSEQPVAGSTEQFAIKGKVGHSFITIEQNIGGTIVRRTLGFYPMGRADPFFNTTTGSALGDNSGDPYNVSWTASLTPAQLNAIIAFITNYKKEYDLENYNCTNFVLDISDIAGLNIPRTNGFWGIGSGLNPGNFGQDLSKMPGAKTGDGHALFNMGCL